MALNSKIKGIIFTALVILFTLTGCNVKVGYSFSGVSISDKIKTVSVQYFQNRASLVQPTLSQEVTDALIDKCKAQTNLKTVRSGGDVSFEGYITEYKSQAFTANSNDKSAMNRFTISIKVKFVNTVEPEYNFDQVFTKYEDYSSLSDFSTVEEELSKKIVDQLIEDIFNKAFVNW